MKINPWSFGTLTMIKREMKKKLERVKELTKKIAINFQELGDYRINLVSQTKKVKIKVMNCKMKLSCINSLNLLLT